MVHVNPPAMPLGGDYWFGGFEESPGTGGPPVWGVADTHAHPMSYLAFGGGLFAGLPDGSPEAAMAWCTPLHGPGGTGLDPLGGLQRLLINGVEGTNGHLVGGFPEFDGWPRFTSTIHQQMHIDWIRRAVDGGLRIMVAHAVDNHLLAKVFSGQEYGDRASVDNQVAALSEFCGKHADVMEIASNSTHARGIINSGRLAVFPGLEVDTLGDWGEEDDATDNDIAEYLHYLYGELGIRHLFPIHLADNALGGACIYNDMFSLLHHELRGDYFGIRDGTNLGLQFRLGEDEGPAVALYRSLGKYDPPIYQTVATPHANSLGLTRQGKFAVEEMMRIGIVVDTDHMSLAAVRETLAIAERLNRPVTAGHTAFQDLAWHRDETAQVHKLPNEYMRTSTDIRRIHRLGGVVSIGLNQGDIRSYGAAVVNDAAGSSKAWAQAYLYALAQTGGAGVAVGTDMDGLAGSIAPRFGLNACYSLHHSGMEDAARKDLRRECVDAQSNGVRYSEPIVDYRQYRFEGALTADEIYTADEQDIWVAAAIHSAGVNPEHAELIESPIWNPTRAGRIRNIAKGFSAASEAELESPFLGGNTYAEQLAGFLVSSGQAPQSHHPAETGRLFPLMVRVWARWQGMNGDNVPLKRNYAGRRDFDINLDGFAHYGMLPDFLQDLRNVGLSTQQLAPLFRSAEAYLRMLQRAEGVPTASAAEVLPAVLAGESKGSTTVIVANGNQSFLTGAISQQVVTLSTHSLIAAATTLACIPTLG